MEFLLLSRDTAKMGMPKVPALIYKSQHILSDRTGLKQSVKPILSSVGEVRSGTADKAHRTFVVEDVWLCPDCYAVQIHPKSTSRGDSPLDAWLMENKLSWTDLAVDKVNGNIEWKKNITQYHCCACGHNLMRSVDPTKEKVPGLRRRRLQPAWFIQKYFSNWIDLVIVDELHQYKSLSGQGEAMGAIVGAAKKVLGLTGTLSDGKASSLFHLLWRIDPTGLIRDGLDHKSLNKFVHLYGSVEQTGRYDEDQKVSAGGNTSRKILFNPPREIPGLSPKLFVNHLADKTVFLELGDLGLPLVELEERPIFISMDEEHALAYQKFHQELEAAMKQSYAAGNHNAFSGFIPAVVNAANRADVQQEIPVSIDQTITFFAPLSEDAESAKERQLVADIRDELQNNRRCVVYVRYSGEAAQDERIHSILQRHGMVSRVMKATISPEERVDWLEKAVKDGVEVVICNAKLVEVGLDLLDFQTLIFYQFTDEIATMRQAARRAWRIGQYRKCKVLYYVYSQSYEMVQFQRMLAKRTHALLLEGRMDRSEVAAFAEKDEKSASAYSIAACLKDVQDLSAKWRSIADRDIPEGVWMLEETKFQQEVHEAMQRLAIETKRLAKVPLELISDQPANEWDDLALFSASESAGVIETVKTNKDHGFTLGAWARQLPKKAKKVQKSQDEDQLLLFAL
ncbi:helicase-related protein [Alicyclobacillus tolerans]|uniref:Superfamily II DNA or RNA helicase n=1 Tax=Alicyclobacillus tolerans TaxID=90970 RepID=A0ABT9LYI5_9BACL|nr:helicase-related protein [Alicyclobacillus tengchongensis]MDP9729329.1 superfamily II DNA or RNA helicase [Alicyclobacillus tengchongensis]